MLYLRSVSGGSPCCSRHVARLFSCCWFLWFSLVRRRRRRRLVGGWFGWGWLLCAGWVCWWRRSCRALCRAVRAGVRRRFAAARRARCSLLCPRVGGRCRRWCAGCLPRRFAALPGGCSPWLRLLWWRFRLVGLCRARRPVGRGSAGLVVCPAPSVALVGGLFARAGLVVSPGGCRRPLPVLVRSRVVWLGPARFVRSGFFIALVFSRLGRVIHIFSLPLLIKCVAFAL